MSNQEDDNMSSNAPQELVNERKQRLLERGREKLRDPEKVRAFLLAGGSIKTDFDIDSQQICREVRGKA